MNQRIFLCHASEDKDAVRRFYAKLEDSGFEPWLDEKDLLPGQLWEDEIPRAIRESGVVLVFLSKVSVSKRGYVQKEFRLALRELEEIPEGEIFIIPIKVGECEVPTRFRRFQWIDIERDDATEKVFDAIRTRVSPNALAISKDGGTEGLSGGRSRSEPRTTNREELEVLATRGRTPSVRRDAIQSLARRYENDSLDFLRDLVWTSNYSAARRVAIDQVAKSWGNQVLPWLRDVAEEHPDSACRAAAAQEVVKLTGLSVCEWALRILRMDDNALVAWGTGHALYSLAKSYSTRNASTGREAAAIVLKSGLPPGLDGSGRECVIGAAILLSGQSPEDRDWATSAAVETPSAYHRARSLAIVLRHWPDAASAINELESVANGPEELASDHARVFLKWMREENWRTIDWHLGLDRRS